MDASHDSQYFFNQRNRLDAVSDIGDGFAINCTSTFAEDIFTGMVECSATLNSASSASSLSTYCSSSSGEYILAGDPGHHEYSPI